MSSGKCFRRHQPLEGKLFTFGDDPSKPLPVFMTGDHKRVLVVVGGQTDRFLSLLSIRQLSSELDKCGWNVAQTMLDSSFCASTRTHVNDAEELQALVEILVEEFDASEITLFGWSTGVQVVMEFLSGSKNAEAVTRVILQGVVVDPNQTMFTDEGVALRTRAANKYCEDGRKVDRLPANVYDQPLSAARLSTGGFPTLMEALWAPAMTGAEEPLRHIMQCLKVPLLLIVACGSEYKLGAEGRNNFRQMLGACASTSEIQVSFHDSDCDECRRMLSGTENEHVAAIALFLKDQDAKRAGREEEDRQAAAEESRRNRSILASSGFQ